MAENTVEMVPEIGVQHPEENVTPLNVDEAFTLAKL
jgi:hypothetical protein